MTRAPPAKGREPTECTAGSCHVERGGRGYPLHCSITRLPMVGVLRGKHGLVAGVSSVKGARTRRTVSLAAAAANIWSMGARYS